MRSLVRTGVVGLLAVGLLAVFLRNADLGRVWEALRGARPGLVLAGVALTLVTYLVRAERWQYLLEPLGPTRYATAFRATVIGFAATAVLPARAGEVIRPYLLARREGLSATAAFATIVVERVLDLVAVLILLAAALLLVEPGVERQASAVFTAVRLGGLVMAPLALAALVVMFVLAGHPDWLQAGLERARRILSARVAAAVTRAVRMFASGFGVLRRPERLAASLGWSLALWGVIGVETWVVARAFDIPISVTGAWLLQALLVVGVSVPTPGGVGGFHEAFRLGATALFGADNDVAIAAAITLHAISFVPVTLLGLWYAAREGLDLRGMREMSGRPVEADA